MPVGSKAGLGSKDTPGDMSGKCTGYLTEARTGQDRTGREASKTAVRYDLHCTDLSATDKARPDLGNGERVSSHDCRVFY